MKKLSKILLAILLFNLFFIANVFASNEENLTVNEVKECAETLNSGEYEYVELENVTYINPLYKDIIDEDDLNQPSNKLLLSEGTNCKTLEEAGKQLEKI